MELDRVLNDIKVQNQNLVSQLKVWLASSSEQMSLLLASCDKEDVSSTSIQSNRNAFQIENEFLSDIPQLITANRDRISAVRHFYMPRPEPEISKEMPQADRFAPEDKGNEPRLLGWLNRIKGKVERQPEPISIPASEQPQEVVVKLDAVDEQRVFKQTQEMLDGINVALSIIKAQIVEECEGTEEMAYNLKCRVVGLTELPPNSTEQAKVVAKRKQLEAAVSCLTHRSTMLTMHSRAIGGLISKHQAS